MYRIQIDRYYYCCSYCDYCYICYYCYYLYHSHIVILSYYYNAILLAGYDIPYAIYADKQHIQIRTYFSLLFLPILPILPILLIIPILPILLILSIPSPQHPPSILLYLTFFFLSIFVA